MKKKTAAQLDREIAATIARRKSQESRNKPDWVIPREPGEPSILDDPKLRAWFGSSHVVDMWGEPLVVYHGTGGTFTALDPAKAGKHSGAETAIRGIYFGDEATARTWARGHRNGRVIKAYLRIERPLYVYGRISGVTEDEALQGDYDGIIQQGGSEWVVFKSNQIKILDESARTKLTATGSRGQTRR